jgi:prevent-host-death family protein
MDVSVRELRNHTARVIAAVESGERVVLTVHGRPVADIVPRVERAEARSSEVFLAELEELRQMWDELGVRGDPADYDTGYTTDDL